MKILRILIVLVVIGFIVSRCGSSSPISPASSPSTRANAGSKAQPVPATWHYESWEDKMTGHTGSYAELRSENTAAFDFPYQGAQHAILSISDGTIVTFEIEKGQFSCTPGCYVLVKFDDEKAESYAFHASGDKWLSIVSYDAKLWKKMFKARHMTGRLTFFQNGSVDFDFNVADLKPFAKPTKSSKATTKSS
jgi:hypothetical protein